MILFFILVTIYFETIIGSTLGIQRVAGPFLLILAISYELLRPSKNSTALLLFLPFSFISIFSPVFLSYFLAPIFSFRLGLRTILKKSKLETVLLILFLITPIADRFFFGQSAFGDRTGYFLFMKEGNVIGYLLYVVWILLYLNITSQYLKLILMFIGFFSAYYSGSNVYLLAVLLLSLRHYAKSKYLIYLFAIFLASLIPTIIEQSHQLKAIIWRLQSGEFSIIDAVLSGRVSNMKRVFSEWLNTGIDKYIFGDILMNSNFYIEMDIFLAIIKLGFYGAGIFLMAFFFIQRDQNVKWNIYTYFLIVMFCLVGHGLFRPISMFALGLLLRNAHNTDK